MSVSKFKWLKLYFIFLSLFAITLGCSSESEEPDPCEKIFCINGDCVDGSCLCDDGWKGPTCQFVDFSGEWRMIQYTTIDCSRYFFTDIKGDGVTRQLCGKADDFDICYETYFILNKDLTYQRFHSLFVHHDDGTIETITSESEDGTWKAESGDTQLRTMINGTSGFRLFNINEDKNSMSRIHRQDDGGTNCKLETAFNKVQT